MIRRAVQSEHDILTTISFRSKAYWQYPQEFFVIWQQELTITPEYIAANDVFLYEKDTAIVAYYSLVELPEDILLADILLESGFWLEHMFVEPEYIGRGIGRELFGHCRNILELCGVAKLKVLADPCAQKFYEKMGCRFIENYPSTIVGRTTPYMEYSLGR